MRPAFEGRTGKQVSDAFQAWTLSYSLRKRNCLKAATHPVWAHKPVSVLSFKQVSRSVLVKVIGYETVNFNFEPGSTRNMGAPR